jgi:uncharacterized protein (TIGR00369 family)
MSDAFQTEILPQLASGAAHTQALGFSFDGMVGDAVRLRVPWNPALIGDPDHQVLAGGLVTTLLDHVGGLAVWKDLTTFQPIATLDLRVDYMRAARTGRDLLAQAHCYKLTRNIAFVRAFAFEDDPSDPVAAAQATYVITPASDKASPRPRPRIIETTPTPDAYGQGSGPLEAIPYANFLGLKTQSNGDELTVIMPFSDHLIGNPMIPALHGGSTAALLEMTAVAQLATSYPRPRLPRAINVTAAYLRSGRADTVFARAKINKAGRRVAQVHAEAWQKNRDHPIATLTAHFILDEIEKTTEG